MTDEAFRAAVGEVLRSERFFPSPAVILDAAKAWESRSRATPPDSWRALPERRVTALEGMDVFKRELKEHGIDVDELTEKFSWKAPTLVEKSIPSRAIYERVPGEDDE